MFTITCQANRWRVSRGNHVVLSGLGGMSAGLAIAKAHGIVISKICTKRHLKAA